MGKALTPKQRVLQEYPNATAYRWAGPTGWVIYANDGLGRSLNVCDATAAKAWQQAWEQLTREADKP